MKQPEPSQTLLFLPDEPSMGFYQVEQVSPLVQRVWLVHHADYAYANGDDVRTIWGFIKGTRVHAPKNHKTMQVKSCCDLVDAYKLNSYSTITPTGPRSLHHLS